MTDNSKEVSTQSYSLTDVAFVMHSGEETAQNGSEKKSDDVEKHETERTESETDEGIFPSKGKKNRNHALLDSDDELVQEPEKNSPSLHDTSVNPDGKMFENEIHSNDWNQPGMHLFIYI
jgi:hypothetical protein